MGLYDCKPLLTVAWLNEAAEAYKKSSYYVTMNKEAKPVKPPVCAIPTAMYVVQCIWKSGYPENDFHGFPCEDEAKLFMSSIQESSIAKAVLIGIYYAPDMLEAPNEPKAASYEDF